MSVMVEGGRYGLEAGSLKEILLGRKQQRSYTVQVLSVSRVGSRAWLSISDGQHVLTNCVAACDVSQIREAPLYCLVRITKWSLVQLLRRSGEDRDKPDYGVRLDEFQMVENKERLSVLGNPKVLRLAVIQEKDSENMKEIVAGFLENIKPDGDNLEDCKNSWAGKILNILKKTGRSWLCIVCKYKISDLLEAKVVSHAQAHLRYFPGYVCHCNPQRVEENLVKYKKHLESDEHRDAVELQKKNSEETLSKLLNSVESYLLETPLKCENSSSEKNDLEEKVILEEADNDADDSDKDNKEDISKVAEELANFMAGDLFSQSFEAVKYEEESNSFSLNEDIPKVENDNDKEVITVEDDDKKMKGNVLEGNKRKIEEIIIDNDEEGRKKAKQEEESFDWNLEISKLIEPRGKGFYCRDPSCWSSRVFGSQSALNHIEKYHFRKVRTFRCRECGVECDSLSNYRAHMGRQHSINLSLTPERDQLELLSDQKCFDILQESLVYKTGAQSINWEQELRGRITVHGESFGCSQCNFKSKPVSLGGRAEILAHIEKSHLNIIGYRCPDCSIMSHSFYSFSLHLNLNHRIQLHLLQNQSLFPI